MVLKVMLFVNGLLVCLSVELLEKKIVDEFSQNFRMGWLWSKKLYSVLVVIWMQEFVLTLFNTERCHAHMHRK